MVLMYYCDLCGDMINNSEAYIGTKEEKLIHSCFSCFIASIKSIEFDNEKVYYPLAGVRAIQLQDCGVFYAEDGMELARVYLESYEEGLIGFIKSKLKIDIGISKDDIFIVIEPFDVRLKQ
jgi:hypothetical protein